MGSGASSKKLDKEALRDSEIRNTKKVHDYTLRAKTFAKQGNYEKQRTMMMKALRCQQDFYGSEDKVSFKVTGSAKVEKLIEEGGRLFPSWTFANGTKFSYMGDYDLECTLGDLPGAGGRKLVRCVGPDGKNHFRNSRGDSHEILRFDKSQGKVTFDTGSGNPQVEVLFHGRQDELLEVAVTLEHLANAHANLGGEIARLDPLNTQAIDENYIAQKGVMERSVAIYLDYYRVNPWHWQVGNAKLNLALAYAKFDDMLSTTAQRKLLEEALEKKEGFLYQRQDENGRWEGGQQIRREREDPDVERVAYMLGQVYQAEGNFERAREMWEKAKEIRLKVYKENHWLVQQVEDELQQLPDPPESVSKGKGKGK